MTVTPFLSRQQPIGTFRAVASRDASSQDRDGHVYYACNRLDTADGRPLAEVQFANGQWLLADPEHDLVPGFYLDSLPDNVYLADSYGPTWNGWATPVIQRPTLNALLRDLDLPHRWEGRGVWIDDDESLFEPRQDGLYDTGSLGWTFSMVDQ